jgi:hypothetical protein
MQDTTVQATAIQLGIYRKLSGVERLQLALEMSTMTRELSRTRLRRAHPAWSNLELNRELLRYAFESAPVPTRLR